MIDDRKGAAQWVLMPRSYRAPGHVKVTRSQVFYPATGLIEERIELDGKQSSQDLVGLPRQ
jgi:hypothetical protein